MTTEEEADDRAACEIESACRCRTVRLASEGHYWIFIFGSAPHAHGEGMYVHKVLLDIELSTRATKLRTFSCCVSIILGVCS